MGPEWETLQEKTATLRPATGTWEEATPFLMRYPLWLTETVVQANLDRGRVMVVLHALFHGWESR